MCTMQLHRVVYGDICTKLDTKPSLSRPSCRSHVTGSLSRFPGTLGMKRNDWGIPVEKHPRSLEHVNVQSQKRLVCASASAIPFPSKELTIAVKGVVTSSLASVLKLIHESQLFRQCAPAVAVMMFAVWGLAPLLRLVHHAVLHEEDSSWKDSQMRYILLSFVRPLLLWVGVIFVCRAFDPLILSTAASQAIKQRFLNFVRSFSTVLAFAQCSLSLTQQLHKVMSGGQSSQDSRSLGAQFVNNAVYTAVWVAAVCLFMELLGFSTQRWLTAGGLGTVLITLAGREIFTNFLSSIMIHATRPFILNEWIQTKIDGYEVSGTVEHVGWWSPTIVRGDDREAVHIPNHKFTVSVVRNLSQKSHWRIKTHFGISHLDVSKVPNIVADMRKVLAKHPQVEQRKLHRRVFFDYINSENQAIMVLVSCFVKTPHFEEYLRVKEIILVDLLKVISHHHARLATPIRSVQRIQEDIESRTSPYRDINRSTEAQGRPYLLVETTAVSSGSRDTESGAMKNGVSSLKENAAGADTTDSGSNTETSESPTDSKVPGKHKPQLEGLDSMGLNSKDITLLGAAFEKPPARIPDSSDDAGQLGDKVASKFSAEMPPARQDKVHNNKTAEPFLQVGTVKSEKVHTRSVENSSHPSGQKIEKGMTKAAVDLEATPLRENNGTSSEETSKRELQVPRNENNDSRLDTHRSQAMVQGSTAKLDTDTHRSQAMVQGSTAKLDTDRGQSAANSPASKGPLEENLVLGVALDGPKRTLPLNEVASVTDQKELVASRNGNSGSVKERRDGTNTTGLNSPDSRER